MRVSSRDLYLREITWNGKEEFTRYTGTLYDSLTQAKVTVTHYDSDGTTVGSREFRGTAGGLGVCSAIDGGSITALGR